LGVDKITETLSADYIKQITYPYVWSMYGEVTAGDGPIGEKPSTIEPWWFTAMQPRVGYIGSAYYFIWNQFATFFTKQNTAGTLVNYK
jgi:hypothetical protein